MTVIAIIPARGGSKRIPRKNLLHFNGKPMIQWTIEAALKAEIFDEVFVSTDDPEIAHFSEKCGLKVPFLREGHFDDHSTVSEATIHALKSLETHYGTVHEHVVQLMPNCPLRRASEIKLAWTNYLEKSHDIQVSCFKFGWMNPWWAAMISHDGVPQHIFDRAKVTRSQDLPNLYCPTGAIWIANVQKLMSQGSFYGTDYRFFEMHWKHAVDIDDFDDFEIAELLAEQKVNSSPVGQ